ncbi:hypothetical protein E4T87_11560 [Micrococcus aloeverae]|nr:hypothetical protein E4T87_11560 [Micrococcus aloeverae]
MDQSRGGRRGPRGPASLPDRGCPARRPAGPARRPGRLRGHAGATRGRPQPGTAHPQSPCPGG